MYGQLKFPILSNQNHGVLVSGEIHITDHENIAHTIEGVKSIEIHETNGTGKIVFKGGFRDVKVAVISVKQSDDIFAVDVTAIDGKAGEIHFKLVKFEEDTGAIVKAYSTEECELSFIGVIATA